MWITCLKKKAFKRDKKEEGDVYLFCTCFLIKTFFDDDVVEKLKNLSCQPDKRIFHIQV